MANDVTRPSCGCGIVWGNGDSTVIKPGIHLMDVLYIYINDVIYIYIK